MGRPWWYDSYWEKEKVRKKRFRLPERWSWAWTLVLVLSLVLAVVQAGFPAAGGRWFLRLIYYLVYYLSRILIIAITVRALLSWFPIRQHHPALKPLDEVVRPVLSPLRRFVPLVGTFDFTPLLAIALLYFIPSVLRPLLLWD